MNKKIPLWAVLLILWFSLIITITFGWAVLSIKNNGYLFKGKTDRAIITMASFPSLVQRSFNNLDTNILIGPILYPTINGFKTETKGLDSNYVLLSVFDKKADQSVIKLVRIYDQKTIYQWKPDLAEIVKVMRKQRKIGDMNFNHHIFWVHPLLLPDGSIIFHTGNPLIKIDKSSKILWYVYGNYHHAIEQDAEGNIWASCVIKPSELLKNISGSYRDEGISKVSLDGKLLFKKSIAEILIENGYRGLLLGVSPYDDDLVHLNDIQPALISSRYWIKGDLLVSLRHKSTVFLYRPSSNKIIWLKTGPWLNQHDVNFVDSTRIGIFGNDIVRMNESGRFINGHSDEYIYDFRTNKTETPYTDLFKKAKIGTITEGRGEILSNGDLFIEETDRYRLVRGNANHIIWQFVDRIDEHSVARLVWSRFISKEEFKKLTFLQTQ